MSEILLSGVTLSYPHVFQKKQFPGGGAAKYSAQFLLHKEKHKGLIDQIKRAILDLAASTYSDKKCPSADRLCLRDGLHDGGDMLGLQQVVGVQKAHHIHAVCQRALGTDAARGTAEIGMRVRQLNMAHARPLRQQGRLRKAVGHHVVNHPRVGLGAHAGQTALQRRGRFLEIGRHHRHAQPLGTPVRFAGCHVCFSSLCERRILQIDTESHPRGWCRACKSFRRWRAMWV